MCRTAPDAHVNQRHAELRLTPDGVELSDLGTGHGTWVCAAGYQGAIAVMLEAARLGCDATVGHSAQGGGAPLLEVLQIGGPAPGALDRWSSRWS